MLGGKGLTMSVIPSLFSRYLIKNFILAFVAALGALQALILLFDSIDLLRHAASRTYVTFLDIFQLAFLKLPQLMPIILPFAILIAALVTFYRLSKTQELVIARAAGLSVWNIILPIIAVTVLIGIGNMTLFNPFSAIMYRKYQTESAETFRHAPAFSWTDKGLWVREKQGNDTFVIHADSVRQNGQALFLQDVLVLQINETEDLEQQIEMSYGVLADNQLSLTSGFAYSDAEGKRALASYQMPINFSIKDILSTFNEPEEISFWRMPRFIHQLEFAGFSSTRHKMHYYTLFAGVFYFVAMVLIAAIFGLNTNQRQGGALYKTTLAFFFSFVLFFLTKLTNALGVSGALPLFLAAFAPSLIVIGIGVTVLLQQEDG